jgi:hypothetical protein
VAKVLEEVAFEVCFEEDPPLFRSIGEVLSKDLCVLLVYDVFGFKSEGVDVLLGCLLQHCVGGCDVSTSCKCMLLVVWLQIDTLAFCFCKALLDFDCRAMPSFCFV